MRKGQLFGSVEEAEAFSARARASRLVHPQSLESATKNAQVDESRPPKRKLVHPIPTETDECKAFIAWTKLVRYRGRPLFDRVIKIPNDRGKRSVFTAIMVAIGMKRGFPDYVILAPIFGYSHYGGLLLEAKRVNRSKVDDDQLAWRELLTEFGYRAEICAGSVEMIQAVREYMSLAAPGDWSDTTKGVM